MRIAGIDADSKKLAVVVFEDDKFDSMHFFESKSKITQERVFDLYFHFDSFIKSSKIDMVVMEESFYTNNFKTSKAITEVLGNCKMICRLNNIPFKMVQNRSWKKTVIGSGDATKDGIKRFVVDRYPQFEREPQDLSDALCVCLYGVFTKLRGDD
jgi:Holliday junction resolvasome RuvABC endonuclease subunit